MAGGDKSTFDKVLPILMSYSSKCELLGDSGAG
jgi:3-hydroxyisobutyrate dehydrogenase-like beta-hydroxyacid dehydrogenase